MSLFELPTTALRAAQFVQRNASVESSFSQKKGYGSGPVVRLNIPAGS
jgi:hypothetical protein